MRSDIFVGLEVRTNRIHREIAEIETWFRQLGVDHEFVTKPEGNLERAAGQLRSLADYFDQVRAKAEAGRSSKIRRVA